MQLEIPVLKGLPDHKEKQDLKDLPDHKEKQDLKEIQVFKVHQVLKVLLVLMDYKAKLVHRETLAHREIPDPLV